MGYDDAQMLREQVAAIKHDLGKYVAWTSANLAPEAWSAPASEELIDALRRDLLSTRTGRDGGVESAWELWARLSAQIERPWPQELQRVDRAVAKLAAAEPALRAGDAAAIGAMATDIEHAQQDIRTQLRALHRRLSA